MCKIKKGTGLSKKGKKRTRKASALLSHPSKKGKESKKGNILKGEKFWGGEVSIWGCPSGGTPPHSAGTRAAIAERRLWEWGGTDAPVSGKKGEETTGKLKAGRDGSSSLGNKKDRNKGRNSKRKEVHSYLFGGNGGIKVCRGKRGLGKKATANPLRGGGEKIRIRKQFGRGRRSVPLEKIQGSG